MTMRNRSSVRWIFLFFVAMLSMPSFAGADHTHFETEKVKSGVVHYKAYRTEAEIAADWKSLDSQYYSPIPWGVPGSGYYDPVLDGAFIPITEGLQEANSLQSSFASVGGDVWIQWEMWVDQDFVDDLPIQSDDGGQWVNTKLFRLANENRVGCDHKIIETVYAS